jgi:hypothetical protein
MLPGWKLVGVVRTSAGGRTFAIPRTPDPDDDRDIVEVGIEAAAQPATPMLYGADGIRGDLRRLAQLERLGIPVCEASREPRSSSPPSSTASCEPHRQAVHRVSEHRLRHTDRDGGGASQDLEPLKTVLGAGPATGAS